MIEFNHTSQQARKSKKEIQRILASIIDQGVFLSGKQTALLSNNLSKVLNLPYVLPVASGHDALLIALRSLNLSSDDEVIFPVNAYPTAFAVALSGSHPVPVDVDVNGQLDPYQLKKKITKKTKAVIVVHLYGLVGDLNKIITICQNSKISLIEDCAQSFGSKYKNKMTGSFGHISCFSFYPTKNLGTLGDGGAIATNDYKTYTYCQKIASYGEKKRYNSHFVTGHSRIPEIQAAILNLYLSGWPKISKQRQDRVKYYLKALSKYCSPRHIRILTSVDGSLPVNHLFAIDAKTRNRLQQYLAKKGIPTLIHYPKPVHLLSAFRFLKNKKGDFPIAEKLSTSILSLPFHQYLTYKEIDFIVNTINKFYAL
jgi:dTDP-4-amino-4,6-dideoxygalactose transaminase